MTLAGIGRMLGLGILVLAPLYAWQQEPKGHGTGTAAPPSTVGIEQPNAERTREEFTHLLEQYPPTLRSVLELDPGLFANQSFLAPYPALVSFLSAHPEVTRNPSYYVGNPGDGYPQDHASQVLDMWKNVLGGLGAFGVFAMVLGFIVWLVRTMIDYRRWDRLAKIQTETHAKILDRFAAHEETLAYIQSPAGSSFLQSSPIRLDAGPRAVDAPLGRILWSVQGGLVLMAGGTGLLFVSQRFAEDASQPLHALGVLGIALGLGFVLSAVTSFLISQRLGLIEVPSAAPRE